MLSIRNRSCFFIVIVTWCKYTYHCHYSSFFFLVVFMMFYRHEEHIKNGTERFNLTSGRYTFSVRDTWEINFLTTDYHCIGFFYPFSNNGDGHARRYADARRRSSCVVALVQRSFFFLFSSFISHVLSTDYTYTPIYTQLDLFYSFLLSLVHYQEEKERERGRDRENITKKKKSSGQLK